MKKSEIDEPSLSMPAPEAPVAAPVTADPTAHLPVDHAAVSRALGAVGGLSGRATLDAFLSELRSSQPGTAHALGLADAPPPSPA